MNPSAYSKQIGQYIQNRPDRVYNTVPENGNKVIGLFDSMDQLEERLDISEDFLKSQNLEDESEFLFPEDKPKEAKISVHGANIFYSTISFRQD